MRINLELYKKYRATVGRKEKDGVFDVTRFPNGLYCFATNQELGDNGRIDNHPMLGKEFKRNNGRFYIMDSVSIHWYNSGYYYHATLRDENGSHTTAMIQNINSKEDLVLEAINEFNENYTLIK